MKKGSDLLDVFSNLNEMLKTVESIDGIEFARDENYGYVTSCPSNLGTGMRASVHVKIPNLTSDGTDKKAKEVCKPLGLSVRGTREENILQSALTVLWISARRQDSSLRKRRSLESCTKALKNSWRLRMLRDGDRVTLGQWGKWGERIKK